jgi:nuclear pore complex protein Nup98-Nup96
LCLLSLLRFSFLSKPVDENHQQYGEDDSLVSRFYTNPIAKPIPQTPESVGNKHNNSNSVDDTIVALNMRVALRNGLEGSSEETSFHDESLQDDREEAETNAYHIHPAGQIHMLFIPLE